MTRLNPARKDFKFRSVVLKQTEEIRTTLSHLAADAPAPIPVVPTIPVDLVYLDGLDPEIIVFEFVTDDGSDIITIPVSSLMQPDPVDPDIMVFPNLTT